MYRCIQAITRFTSNKKCVIVPSLSVSLFKHNILIFIAKHFTSTRAVPFPKNHFELIYICSASYIKAVTAIFISKGSFLSYIQKVIHFTAMQVYLKSTKPELNRLYLQRIKGINENSKLFVDAHTFC